MKSKTTTPQTPKTFLIDVPNIYRANQLDALPRVFNIEDKYQIFLNTVGGDQFDTQQMYDDTHSNRIILNTLTSEIPALSYFDPITNQFVNHWHNKLCQQKILQAYAKYARLECYHHLPIYSWDSFLYGRYVIKPINGHQSYGVIKNVFANEKGKSIRQFLKSVEELPVNDEGVEKAKALLKEWGYTLLSVSDDKIDDSLKLLCKQSVYIQEANPYIQAHEYRVVKCLDQFFICQREDSRKNKWTDLQPIVNIMDSNGFPGKTRDEISSFLRNFPFLTYGSLDLWVSSQTEHWGIYEFQPQYGRDLIPTEYHIRFLKRFIEAVVSGEAIKYIDEVNKNWLQLTGRF